MQITSDKVLLGFLAGSIVFYLLSLQFVRDTAVVPYRDSVAVGADTTSVQNSPNTKQVTLDSSSYELKAATATRWKLPKRLREISGLAMTNDNRLLAHNDESGVVFEVDYQNGSIVKSFGLGDLKKPVSGDFEGIATVQDTIYLVTSSGRLYECREGVDGETVLFNVYATGVGREYEIEGLAYVPGERVLLIMSKNPMGSEQKGKLTIYRWSVDTRQLVENGHTIVPLIDITRYIKGKKFQPSGIERHPVSENYFIVAARQNAMAEVTPTGQVVGVVKFPAKWHRQIEGITFASDHTLIVSDEGARKRATLTIYPMNK